MRRFLERLAAEHRIAITLTANPAGRDGWMTGLSHSDLTRAGTVSVLAHTGCRQVIDLISQSHAFVRAGLFPGECDGEMSDRRNLSWAGRK